MNSNQRLALLVAFAAGLILTFLHSPWTGYFAGEYTPFSEWQTVSPLVYWLGLLPNFLASLALVATLACLWVWGARTTNPDSSDA